MDQRIEFDMVQPPPGTDITLTPHSPWVWHASRDGKRLGTVSGDRLGGFTARDINQRSIGHGYVSAQAATQAWASPTLSSRITSTRPSQSVWRVSFDGERVGTVYGDDSEVGFTARDTDFHLIGRGYVCAEAAMQACVPMTGTPAVASTVISPEPEAGHAGRRTA